MKGLVFDRDNVFFRCVEDSSEAIMITDDRGVLKYVNPAWQNIYEYSFEEAIGKTPGILRSFRQTDDFYKEMWKRILDPKIGSWKGNIMNRSKSGLDVPVFLTISPIQGDGGVVGYMGTAVDVSEKRDMESKILQQDRLASIGLLASGIAHEIGTPLGVLRGRAELLSKQLSENEKTVNTINIMLVQIDRISKIIQNLLTLSRGQQSSGRCFVAKVIEEVYNLMGQKFKEFGIEFVADIAPDLRVAMGHNELEQVLLNLVINSVFAIDRAQKSQSSRSHSIVIQVTELGTSHVLSVRDSGCGISPNDINKIFQPFYTTKPVGEGTGLGLSISYRLVREAKGDIQVDSQVGAGTTFRIQLPKA
ncbi:MAG: PAS domain S-box protein [Oligoflexia bacterium]|nr:PAS domain S-box protein [Oligoflexia bacterium]